MTRMIARPTDRACADDHRLPIGIARRILHQVGQGAFDLHEVCTHGPQLGIDSYIKLRLARLRSERGVDHLLDGALRQPRRSGMRLELREIQQVVDQPRQACSFVDDQPSELVALRRRQVGCANGRTGRDHRCHW